MTIRKANILIQPYQGYGKTESDFVAMIHSLSNAGLLLMDGDINYNNDMTNKHYVFRLSISTIDEYDQVVEGKTVGYLTAYKCWARRNDDRFEILAYIS